jgi:histidinol phosphatase-like enzyme (inositol monophosphatase family)
MDAKAREYRIGGNRRLWDRPWVRKQIQAGNRDIDGRKSERHCHYGPETCCLFCRLIFRVFSATCGFKWAVDPEPYRQFIFELAQQSGDFLRPFFGAADLAVEFKADRSPVTAADRGAEELLRALIARRFPTHGVVGEEFGPDRADAEFVWMLDPIDGTKSFITGVPLWGTLIALLYEGEPVLGAIHQPVLRQLMVGNGSGTTLNGRAVKVRPCASVEEATLLCSDPLHPAEHQNGPAFAALATRARLVRTWGDCYGYLLLAGGWADIMCDPVMNPWDIAALVPVVRGAGGTITDWQGQEPMRGQSIVAAGPGLHAQVIAALNPSTGK